MSLSANEVLHVSPVIPVVTLPTVESAVPLARALWAGGIRVIEVTLRTDAALAGIREILAAAPDMVVGVGTIWSPSDLEAAIATGAHFGVSPGATPKLMDAIVASQWPFLPGCSTTSEVADKVERGLRAVKFFPAESYGGVATLKGFSAVFPGLEFCPTGGISAATAPHYRALDSVPTVGGSWLTPKAAVAEGRWEAITELAREAIRGS